MIEARRDLWCKTSVAPSGGSDEEGVTALDREAVGADDEAPIHHRLVSLLWTTNVTGADMSEVAYVRMRTASASDDVRHPSPPGPPFANLVDELLAGIVLDEMTCSFDDHRVMIG